MCLSPDTQPCLFPLILLHALQAMFNQVPALPCAQLPRTLEGCAALFHDTPTHPAANGSASTAGGGPAQHATVTHLAGSASPPHGAASPRHASPVPVQMLQPHARHVPAPQQQQHDYAQGEARHGSYADAADRAVAALTVGVGGSTSAATGTTNSTVSSGSASGVASGGGLARPQVRRALCLCSQLDVLHYEHGPGEQPEAVAVQPADDDRGAMDLDDDG